MSDYRFEEVTMDYIGDEYGEKNIWAVDYRPVGSLVSFVGYVELVPITPNVTHVYTVNIRHYMGAVHASGEDEFMHELAAVIEKYWDER